MLRAPADRCFQREASLKNTQKPWREMLVTSASEMALPGIPDYLVVFDNQFFVPFYWGVPDPC